MFLTKLKFIGKSGFNLINPFDQIEILDSISNRKDKDLFWNNLYKNGFVNYENSSILLTEQKDILEFKIQCSNEGLITYLLSCHHKQIPHIGVTVSFDNLIITLNNNWEESLNKFIILLDQLCSKNETVVKCNYNIPIINPLYFKNEMLEIEKDRSFMWKFWETYQKHSTYDFNFLIINKIISNSTDNRIIRILFFILFNNINHFNYFNLYFLKKEDIENVINSWLKWKKSNIDNVDLPF